MRRIYLHSPQADFAETQRLPQLAYLGRRVRPSSLRLCSCGCDAPLMVRITRAFWMRLLPFFRHYLCRRCGDRVFRWKLHQRSTYSAVYLPAPSTDVELPPILREYYARLFQRAAA
jgi:hypothetical protein